MARAVLWFVLWTMVYSLADARGNGAPGMLKTERAKPATRPSEKPGAIRVRVQTTLGDVILELDAEKAPVTVANFLDYVDEGFYNGTVFHRVIPHFLIQGGGYTTASLIPKTDGLNPPIKNEWNNGLKNVRLTIGAARVPGKPDSATSQFYINVVDNPRLDQAQEDGAGYAVFGRVIGGEDVVEKIRTAKLRVHSSYREPSGRPITPSTLIEIDSVDRIDADGNVIEPVLDLPEELEPDEPSAPEDAEPSDDDLRPEEPAESLADQDREPGADHVELGIEAAESAEGAADSADEEEEASDEEGESPNE